MAKLTASDLIRMAAAQGIALVQAGAPTSHNGDVDALRRDNVRLSAELARVIALPLNGSAETLAELERVRADNDRLRRAYEGMRMQRQEPANLAELQACKDALARAIKERDEARGAHAKDRDALMREATEARAEVVSLQRTVEKLRPLAQRGDSIPEAQPAPATLRATFLTFPSWPVVERLRTFGRWNKHAKAWELQDTPEAREYLDSLRSNGLAFTIS